VARSKKPARKKKLVPVEVDYNTRWGSTKKKEGETSLGRAIKNVLFEMGIPERVHALEIKPSVETKLVAAHGAAIRDLHDIIKSIEADIGAKLPNNMRVWSEDTDKQITDLKANVRVLREGMANIVQILDRVTTEAKPVVDTTPPPRATGTEHGLRLACTCGLVVNSVEAYSAHYHAVHKTGV
jgi:hypothetical protein